MASDASRLYSRNVSALLEHLAPAGVLALDFDDEITAGTCVAGAPDATPETKEEEA
jgi:NAD(P) transhydrogenase subunit alpha